MLTQEIPVPLEPLCERVFKVLAAYDLTIPCEASRQLGPDDRDSIECGRRKSIVCDLESQIHCCAHCAKELGIL